MSGEFRDMDLFSIKANSFQLIGNEWMLLTAGKLDSFNMMTASWGGLGVLWDKNVCYCFIRPTRFTYQFFEKSEAFTVSFFEEKYRNVLEYCGSHSGRDVNKVAETGLTPMKGPLDTIFFKEARLVFVCKKIYFQDIIPEHFIDQEIHKNYPLKDYHRMYIGEIVRCMGK
jgi:flavin reductase (DIM6/NTAB) family NADH-FMN oxidoreductase RutF